MTLVTSRRALFGFGAALLAAPAIVRVASLMPVSVPKYEFIIRRWLPYGATVTGATQPRLFVSATWWKTFGEDDVAKAMRSDFIIVPDRLPERA